MDNLFDTLVCNWPLCASWHKSANDFAQQDGKTTVSMHHVKKALEDMEFSQFIEELDDHFKGNQNSCEANM